MTSIARPRLTQARTRVRKVFAKSGSSASTGQNAYSMASDIRRIPRRPLAMVLVATLAVSLPAAGAKAMDVHVNGNKIFLSGDVKSTDLYKLAGVIDLLHKQGRTIDTLVLRNSRGGSVVGGYDVGDFARRNHLTTVVSGYCISACSMMLVGGSERAFAAGDQPLLSQYIGIHGVTGYDNKGRPIYVDSSRPTAFYQYFFQAIAGGDPGKTDMQLLDDAFSDHGSSVAYLYGPAAKRNPSVFWCHSSCSNPKQYKAYPNDNVYNLGFITQQTPIATNDTLVIDKDTSGNVNLHYYNAYGPAAKPYFNEDIADFAVAWNFLTAHMRPELKPVLTKKAFLDDVEVELYNQLSPSERKRLLTKYLTEYFLTVKKQTPEQLRKKLENPRSYESTVFAMLEHTDAPFVDPGVFSLDDSYGVIRVTNHATWTLGKGQRTAADALFLDQGRVRLDGGSINVPGIYIQKGGRLDGQGFVGEPWHSKDRASQLVDVNVLGGGIVHPIGGALNFTGGLRFNDNSILVLDVNPDLVVGRAPIQLGKHVDFGGEKPEVTVGWVVPSQNALLALNVKPDFYRPGGSLSLIGLTSDVVEVNAALRKLGINGAGAIMMGSFRHLARADADGNVLPGYSIDPSSKIAGENLFHPFDRSLLSFKLTQNSLGASLQATNPFTDPSFCGNRGCGLGRALSAAAQGTDKGLQSLLRALEFSTPEQAAHAAKQLRGESYGSLRTASLSLLGAFGNTLNQHLRAVDPGSDQAAELAIAGGASGMGLNNPRHAADLSSMMSYLVANDDGSAGAASASSDVATWGRLFSSRGRLDTSEGVAGLRQHSGGVMLGVDRRLNAGTVIGASFGYGKLRAAGADSNSADASGFNARVRALDARFYVDHRFDRGYLDAGLAYTRLRNSSTRSIQLPLFSAVAHARYGGNAWSLHLEHGWTLQDRHGVLWQPILPSIDVTRLPGEQFADQGAGAAGLQVDAKRRFDPRIGAGLQVAKSFAWGSGTLTPHARVLLQHRFINNENTFMASLQGYPQGLFDVASQREARNHGLVNVGLSARRGDRTALLLDYVGDFARRHRDQGAMFGVRHRW